MVRAPCVQQESTSGSKVSARSVVSVSSVLGMVQAAATREDLGGVPACEWVWSVWMCVCVHALMDCYHPLQGLWVWQWGCWVLRMWLLSGVWRR